MKRLSFLLILLLALSSACLGWYAYTQQQEVDRLHNLGMSSSERDTWQKRVWALEKRLAALDSKGPAIVESSNSDAGDAPDQRPGEIDGPGPQGPGRGRRGGPMEMFAALSNTPEFQKLMSAQQRGAVESRYAALFKGLSLPAADLDKLKTLLADKQSAVFDVLTAARAQGLAGRDNRDQVQQMIQSAQGEVDQSIQQLIGAQGFSQYQNYEATLSQRATVDLLDKRLSYTQTPLTDQQSQQLIGILASTASSNASGNPPQTALAARNAFGLGGTMPAPIKDQAVQLAQGVLAGPQLEALQQMQQEQQAAQQLARLLRNPPANAAPRNSSTPASKNAPASASKGGS